MKILIPVGVVVLAAIVVGVLWLTGVLSFGQGKDIPPEESPTRSASRNEEDDEEGVRTPPTTTSTTPSPFQPSPTAPSPPPPPANTDAPLPIDTAGGISGRGGEVRVNGTTEIQFTPDRSGVWQFRTSDNEGDPYLTIYDSRGNYIAEDDDSGGSSNALVTVPLDAGTTYVIEAGFYGDGSGSYTLTVSEAEAFPGGGGDVRVNISGLFAFSPGRSGVWEIFTSNDDGCDPNLRINDANGYYIAEDDDGIGDYNAHLALYMESGEAYIIDAGCYGSRTGSYTLTVRPADALPGRGGDVRVRGGTGFSFTPDRTGIWELRTSGGDESDPVLMIYGQSGEYVARDDDGAGGYDSLIETLLIEGVTYAVNVHFYDVGGCSLSVSLKTEVDAVASGATLPDGGGSFMVAAPAELMFSPNRSGLWVIYTSDNGGCDPYLQLLDSRGDVIDYDDDGAGSYNALIIASLDSRETYIISAECYSGSSGMYMLNVTFPSELPASGGNVSVDGPTVFAFTPGQSGTWQLRTSDNGNSDPYLSLFNSDGYQIDYDDDGAGDYNSLIVIDLTAGQTYGIFAGFYGSGTGTYTLSVTRG